MAVDRAAFRGRRDLRTQRRRAAHARPRISRRVDQRGRDQSRLAVQTGIAGRATKSGTAFAPRPRATASLQRRFFSGATGGGRILFLAG